MTTNTPASEVPWTPGDWRAEPDEYLHGALHTEEMRKVDPAYKPEHKYWVIHAWQNGGGRYVAETGCHEHSEANARLIAESPTMAALLEEMVARFSNVAGDCDDVEQGAAEIRTIGDAKACLARIRSVK